MNLDIRALVEDAESIRHGQQKGKGARAKSGPYWRAALRWLSKAQPWTRSAVPLLVLLALAPLAAQAQSALDGFDPGANGEIRAFAVQADGKILVAGPFWSLGGGGTGTTTRNRIGRLNADGSLDTSFDPGANGGVEALAIQADGKILVGGDFMTLGGGGTGTTSRNFIGRLTNTDAASQSLSVNSYGTTITWKRGGASPEVDRVTFELSTDGATYTPLGAATRISGGWQLTGLSLPRNQNIFIRAHGFYSSGWFNGSGSIVEVRGEFSIEPGPTVTSINPTYVTAGGAAFILTVNRTHFLSSSTVQWNGSNRTTNASSTQLTAAIPTADTTSAETASATVVIPLPRGGNSHSTHSPSLGPKLQPNSWFLQEVMMEGTYVL